MDAADLARWTRFAAKGGIGKCTAVVDCVAESVDDLMFLKDDEITVLMQLAEPHGIFLGYCEGVVGRFSGKNVRFHAKLKKPVMAKRSSVSSTNQGHPKSHSPSPMITVQHDSSPVTSLNESSMRPPLPTDENNTTLISPSFWSRFAFPLSADGVQVRNGKASIALAGNFNKIEVTGTSPEESFSFLDPVPPLSPRKASHLTDEQPNPCNSLAPSQPDCPPEDQQPPPSSSDHEAGIDAYHEDFPLQLDLSTASSPTPSTPSPQPSIQRQSQSRSSLRHDSISSAYSQASTGTEDLTILQRADTLPPSSDPIEAFSVADPDLSTTTHFDTSRLSISSSDGEVGIGLSLLQHLADNESDDEWSNSDSDVALARKDTIRRRSGESVCQRGSGITRGSIVASTNSTPKKERGSAGKEVRTCYYSSSGDEGTDEGLRYEDTETGHGNEDDPNVVLEADIVQTQHQFASVTSSANASPSQENMTFPPVAPLSPSRKHTETYVFPTPPTHTHRGSVASRRSLSSSYAQPPPAILDGERERRPSATSVSTDWEGDIYDDYRYSRFSIGGTSTKAATVSGQRNSVASRSFSVISKISGSSRSGKMRIGSVVESRVSVVDLPDPFPPSPPPSIPTTRKNTESISNRVGGSDRSSMLSRPSVLNVEWRVGATGTESTGELGRKDSFASSESDGSVYTQSSEGKRSAPGATSDLTSPTSSSFTKFAPATTMSPPSSQASTLDLPTGLANQSPTFSNLPDVSDNFTPEDQRLPLLHTSWLTLPSDTTVGAWEDVSDTEVNKGFTGKGGNPIPTRTSFFPGPEEVTDDPKEGKERFPDVKVVGISVEDEGTKDLVERSPSPKKDQELQFMENRVEETLLPLTPRTPLADADPEKVPAFQQSPQSPIVAGLMSSIAPISLPPSPSAGPLVSHLRPSLHELRGGEPGSGERRSLFLPHPNAPKASNISSQGPMYITQQQPVANNLQPVCGTAVQAIRMALTGPGLTGRKPTIYGKTVIDLSSAIGPVLIMFSVEPPPAPTRTPSVTSPTIGPPLTLNHTRTCVGAARIASPITFQEAAESTARAGAVIPRQNFLPSAGGVRPRSRSFSGFQTLSVEVPVSAQESQEGKTKMMLGGDGTKQLSSTPRPLSNSRSLLAISPITRSPRLNPVQTQGPSSPLAQSTFTESDIVPTSPRIGFLRHITSRSKLSEAPIPSSLKRLRSGTVSNGDLRTTASATPPLPSPLEISSPSQLLSPLSPFPVSLLPPSLSMNTSTPSPDPNPGSLVPGTSKLIQTKLSLPNLRHMETPTSIAESLASAKDRVQVKDMDFELVRPTIPQLQTTRSSEDSSILGKDGAVDPRLSTSLLCPDSPALSAPRSPGLISDTTSVGSVSYVTAKILPDSPRPSDSEASMDAHRQREQKWMVLLNSTPASQATKSKKIKKLLLEGVPSSVRYLVWSHLTNGKARIVPGVYTQLCARPPVPAFPEVEGDIQRYLVDHPQVTHGPVLSVLQAYLSMVPDVQYTMGLTLIAGHLLVLAPEEDAFWIFVSVMDRDVRAWFSSNTTQLEVDAALFSRALDAADPALGKKMFVELGILPITICRPWFTTLFVDCLPLNLLNRVWDVFLFEGVPFLLRVGLAISSCVRRQIMESTSEEAALLTLMHPPPDLLPANSDAFVSLAFSAKLKDDDVKKQRIKLEAEVKRQTQAPRPSGSISLPCI